MNAPTTLTSAIAALALAAPVSAQLAGERPVAADPLDFPQPFVTEAVRAGLTVLFLKWEEGPTQIAQFCLDGRVIEDPAHGRVALIETVTRVESGSDCRGEWTLGSLLFLPPGDYSDELIGDFACEVLSARPDWHVFGLMRGRDIESSSLWCANWRTEGEASATGASSN
jgi:hypothetical protein